MGPRRLGVRSLALISLAAVVSLRIFPGVAQDGWSSIAYYLFGALSFFLPLALVAAELRTGWPKAGGLYVAMLALLWALTLANFFGMKWTARLNNIGVILGTRLPAVVLIFLGAYWLLTGSMSLRTNSCR